MKKENLSLNAKSNSKLNRLTIGIIALIVICLISVITYAFFTDKKDYSGNLEFGTIKISTDNGQDNQDVTFNLSRYSGPLGEKIMPGDSVSCNVRIKNVGLETCYYLICFISDNSILATSFNLDYYLDSSDSTQISTISTKKLGTLAPNETKTVSVNLNISEDLATGQNSSSNIKCCIYAIQVANLTEGEAWDLIHEMKTTDNPDVPIITLYNEDGTASDGSNSITSGITIVYTDSTKSQFYLDASSLGTSLTNSEGEELYFYSTTNYSSQAFASKYITSNSSNSTISFMNAQLTSKTDTTENSYLAELSSAQNYDLTFNLSNKIIYDTPKIALNLYPVFLKPNYGNTDTSLNTYVKGTTPYLIISKDKTSTSAAEFNSHTNIKAVVIPNTISTITERTFVNCSSLEYVVWPTSNLKTLGYQCFAKTAIKNLILPDCLESLNNSTSYTGALSLITTLKSVKLPANLTTAAAAFYQSSVETVIFDEKCKIAPNQIFNRAYNLQNVKFNNVETIDTGAFYNCTKLSNINLPNSLQMIKTQAFARCSSLKTINLPNSLQMIGQQAFSGCSSLKTINLPNSLKSLGNTVFYQTGLTGEIGLPYQCEILGTSNSAFVEMSGITGFYIKDANGNRITETTFTGQSGEITYLTNGDGCLYKKLDGNNIRLELFPGGYVNKEFRIGANVTQFRRFELENSYNVEKFIVDKNNEYFENDSYGVIYVKKQTSYDGRTFTKDMLLSCPTGATFTSYTMKDGISGVYLFSAKNLEHLTIPTNTTMTTIPGCCLQGANKLKTINSSVDGVFDLSGLNITEIGYKSFEFCYGLKEMILPASCTTIDNAAFRCSGITKLTTYATTKLTLKTGTYLESGKLLDKTGTYFENGVEKYKGLQNIYVLNSDLIAQYQNDKEWNTYLSKKDGEDYKLNISVIA